MGKPCKHGKLKNHCSACREIADLRAQLAQAKEANQRAREIIASVSEELAAETARRVEIETRIIIVYANAFPRWTYVDAHQAVICLSEALEKARANEHRLHALNETYQGIEQRAEQAEADLKLAEAKLERLKPYTMHLSDCASIFINEENLACDCGLEEALK